MTRRVSVQEYAKLLGVCEQTVGAMCRKGTIKARRIAGRWQIDVEASDRMLSLRFGNVTERELAKKP